VNDDSEASQVSFKVDSSADARVRKKDFENLLREHSEFLKIKSDGLSSSVSAQAHDEFLLPTEVITGRLLTHYDETAGVALPHSAMEQHKRLGNTVLPLLESYRSRYDRLRGLLTGKLFPRRENLLQLRRQLQNCSLEVEAARKGIERETMSDAEQILERLRSVEAMRQSTIKHQVGAILSTVSATSSVERYLSFSAKMCLLYDTIVQCQVLQLEVELETIERVVRRIEQANNDTSPHQPSGDSLLITFLCLNCAMGLPSVFSAPSIRSVEDVKLTFC
jgi:chaperonin cofactor prefoldin